MKWMSTLLCCAFFAVLHKAEEAPWSRRHVVKERIASVVVEILRISTSQFTWVAKPRGEQGVVKWRSRRKFSLRVSQVAKIPSRFRLRKEALTCEIPSATLAKNGEERKQGHWYFRLPVGTKEKRNLCIQQVIKACSRMHWFSCYIWFKVLFLAG